jgi:hypothetical protein
MRAGEPWLRSNRSSTLVRVGVSSWTHRLTRRIVSDKDWLLRGIQAPPTGGGRRCLLRRAKYSPAWSWQVP